MSAPLISHMVNLRSDMLKAIAAHYPTDIGLSVIPHDGDWGESEMRRYSQQAPALILVFNGGESKTTSSNIRENMSVSAFIVTKSTCREQRTNQLLALVEHFFKLVHNTDWGSAECTQQPMNIRNKNMYSGKIDKMALGLWAFQWDQLIEIPYLEGDAALDDFATLFSTFTTARPTEDPADTAASETQTELEVA